MAITNDQVTSAVNSAFGGDAELFANAMTLLVPMVTKLRLEFEIQALQAQRTAASAATEQAIQTRQAQIAAINDQLAGLA